MPRYLAEVRGKVCVWSSIVDAPVSPFFASEEALRAWMRIGFWEFDPGNKRLTEAQVVAFNRAGAGETCIGAEELVRRYGG